MALLQSVAVLLIVFSDDNTTNLLPAYMGNLAQWSAVLVALLTLLLAVLSARWAAKQWRLQYFTKEWSTTIQFLIANSQFMDAAKNKEYQAKYSADELVKYELIARLSVGYVDDLYHLRTGKYLRSWLRGSVKVFVHPHRSWFLQNSDTYNKKFVKYVKDNLPQEGKS